MADLNDYDTWEKIAGAMGDVAHEYDLADTSERVDVVQLVCEAAARLGYHLVEDTPERADLDQAGQRPHRRVGRHHVPAPTLRARLPPQR